METASAKELIGLLSDHTSKWQTLWTTFYSVSAAIVTLIASGKIATDYVQIASFVAAAMFVFFAAGNYQSLEAARKQREALVDFIKTKAKDSPQIVAVAEAAAPPSYVGLRVYHWGLCIFVIIFLFTLPFIQNAPK